MKVLTAAQMREADRQSIAAGIPGLVLMENAAYAVLRELEKAFPSLRQERVAIFCGKGNNGGDGLAIARLLKRLHRPASLDVLLAFPVEQLGEDAAAQLRMLKLSRVDVHLEAPPHLAAATLAIDAMLGTGSEGEPKELLAKWIRVFNDLPLARGLAYRTRQQSLRTRGDYRYVRGAEVGVGLRLDGGTNRAACGGGYWNSLAILAVFAAPHGSRGSRARLASAKTGYAQRLIRPCGAIGGSTRKTWRFAAGRPSGFADRRWIGDFVFARPHVQPVLAGSNDGRVAGRKG